MLWFLIAIASVIAVIGLACLYCFRECFFSSKNRDQDPYAVLEGPQYAAVADRIRACTARMDEVEYEWVSTVSHDGLPLWGRYYHVRDNAPVKLIFHGYRSPALRDSAGGWFLARKLGFNVLAVDQRAHARSGGTVITFGILERQDCLSWVRYINGRFGSETPVILCGLSMGAATVLMASGLKLPNNVAAIMADSPYSAPADIIRKVCRDRHLSAQSIDLPDNNSLGRSAYRGIAGHLSDVVNAQCQKKRFVLQSGTCKRRFNSGMSAAYYNYFIFILH